ncbi:unnamed protein product [Gordionus sp. m RMFG-2023]
MSKLFQWKKPKKDDSSDEDQDKEAEKQGNQREIKKGPEIKMRRNAEEENGDGDEDSFQDKKYKQTNKSPSSSGINKSNKNQDKLAKSTSSDSLFPTKSISKHRHRNKHRQDYNQDYEGREMEILSNSVSNKNLRNKDSLVTFWELPSLDVHTNVNYEELIKDYGLNINILKHDLPLEILRTRLYHLDMKINEKFCILIQENGTREKQYQELRYDIKCLADKIESKEEYANALKEIKAKLRDIEIEMAENKNSMHQNILENQKKLLEFTQKMENMDKMSKESEIQKLQDYISKELIEKSLNIEKLKMDHENMVYDLNHQISLLQKQCKEESSKDINPNALNLPQNFMAPNTFPYPYPYKMVNLDNEYMPTSSKISSVLPSASQVGIKRDTNYNEALIEFLQQRCVNLEKALLTSKSPGQVQSSLWNDSGMAEEKSGSVIVIDTKKYDSLGRSKDSTMLNCAITTLKTLLISKEREVNSRDTEVKSLMQQIGKILQDNIEKDVMIEKMKILCKDENLHHCEEYQDRPRRLSEIDLKIRNILHEVKEEKSLKDAKAKLMTASYTITKLEQELLTKDNTILELQDHVSHLEDTLEKLRNMFEKELERSAMLINIQKDKKLIGDTVLTSNTTSNSSLNPKSDSKSFPPSVKSDSSSENGHTRPKSANKEGHPSRRPLSAMDEVKMVKSVLFDDVSVDSQDTNKMVNETSKLSLDNASTIIPSALTGDEKDST